MQSFTVNPDSWHYKFNQKFFWRISSNEEVFPRETKMPDGTWDFVSRDNLPKDFCTYWRHTILYSGFMALLFGIAIIAVLALIGLFFYQIFLTPVDFLIGLGGVLGVIAIMFGFIFGIEKILEITKEWRRMKLHPFVARQWRNWLHYPFLPIKWFFQGLGWIIEMIVMGIGDAYLYIRGLMAKKPDEDTPMETLPPREPSMFWQKVISLKGKFCPRVEYTS